jgi:hypothetical protein
MLAAKRCRSGAFDMFSFGSGVSPGACVSALAHDLRFGTIRAYQTISCGCDFLFDPYFSVTILVSQVGLWVFCGIYCIAS